MCLWESFVHSVIFPSFQPTLVWSWDLEEALYVCLALAAAHVRSLKQLAAWSQLARCSTEVRLLSGTEPASGTWDTEWMLRQMELRPTLSSPKGPPIRKRGDRPSILLYSLVQSVTPIISSLQSLYSPISQDLMHSVWKERTSSACPQVNFGHL